MLGCSHGATPQKPGARTVAPGPICVRRHRAQPASFKAGAQYAPATRAVAGRISSTCFTVPAGPAARARRHVRFARRARRAGFDAAFIDRARANLEEHQSGESDDGGAQRTWDAEAVWAGVQLPRGPRADSAGGNAAARVRQEYDAAAVIQPACTARSRCAWGTPPRAGLVGATRRGRPRTIGASRAALTAPADSPRSRSSSPSPARGSRGSRGRRPGAIRVRGPLDAETASTHRAC